MFFQSIMLNGMHFDSLLIPLSNTSLGQHDFAAQHIIYTIFKCTFFSHFCIVNFSKLAFLSFLINTLTTYVLCILLYM